MSVSVCVYICARVWMGAVKVGRFTDVCSCGANVHVQCDRGRKMGDVNFIDSNERLQERHLCDFYLAEVS